MKWGSVCDVEDVGEVHVEEHVEENVEVGVEDRGVTSYSMM